LEPYLKTPEINKSDTHSDVQFFSPITIKTNEDVNQIIDELKSIGVVKEKDDFMVLPGYEVVAVFFERGNKKEKIEQVRDFIKILD
jgi:hypothetical protein